MMAQPGPGDSNRFASNYGQMSETELMALAAAYDTLVEPAQTALRAEFARRGLQPPPIEDEEVTEVERLVTVRRYRDLSEAFVGRSVLESSGIFCFLQDENFVRLNWFDSNAVGGLRLQVRPENLAEAEEALSQPVPETIPFGGLSDYKQPHCPACGSVDISFEGQDRRLALASMWVASVPLPLVGDSSWLCHSCGRRWIDDEEDSKDEFRPTPE